MVQRLDSIPITFTMDTSPPLSGGGFRWGPRAKHERCTPPSGGPQERSHSTKLVCCTYGLMHPSEWCTRQFVSGVIHYRKSSASNCLDFLAEFIRSLSRDLLCQVRSFGQKVESNNKKEKIEIKEKTFTGCTVRRVPFR